MVFFLTIMIAEKNNIVYMMMVSGAVSGDVTSSQGIATS